MNTPLAWLLDTNVFSEMMRPNPEPRVSGFLDSIAGEGLGLSSVTVWEVLNGIGLLEPGRRRTNLAQRVQDLLDDLFEGRVLDWTASDAKECARLMEEKRQRGESLDSHLPDAMLAGTALSRGLTIATRNESEFRNTGVRTVNPWTAPYRRAADRHRGRPDPADG